MLLTRIDRSFARFRSSGDPRALAHVFDATAPELWRVAAHLCRDRHDAEDAVQATFLRAIEAREAWDGVRPVLPWLLGLLVNRAREQRRARARAVDPARVALPAAADPAVVAADREFGAALTAALATVAEPFRAVLERHLVHDHAPARIAAELGVPAATVRTRLHRGLAQLRSRLPAGAALGGGIAGPVPLQAPGEVLAAMRTLVLGRVPGGAACAGSSSAGAAVVGGLSLGALVKALLGVAAATVLGLAWWSGAAATTPVRPDAPSGGPVAGALAAERARVDERAGGAVVPAVEVGGTPAREERIEAARAGELRVVVRHGGTREPIAAVRVIVRIDQRDTGPRAVKMSDAPSALQATPASAEGHPTDDAPTHGEGATGADGAVTFRLAAGVARVHAQGGLPEPSTVTVIPGQLVEHDHELAVAFHADVRVVDARGGAVADASILGHVETSHEPRELGRTDADGRWRDGRVEPRLLLRAVAPGYAASAEAAVRAEPIVLTLDAPAGSVHGTVLDPAGAPLANAVVVLEPVDLTARTRAPWTTRTDARGAFRCDTLRVGEHDVLVRRDLARDARAEAFPIGRRDRASLSAASGSGTSAAPDSARRAPQDPSARADATPLVRTFRVVANAPIGPPVELRCERGAMIVAQLRRHDGRAAPRATLALQPSTSGVPRAFLPWLNVHTTADDHGRAVLADVRPARCTALLEWQGAVGTRSLDLRAGAIEHVEFTFAELVTLHVEVVDEQGQPRAGVHVARRVDGTETSSLATNERGEARFEHVMSGPHEVALRIAPDRPIAARHTVIAGQPVRLVLPRTLPTCRVVGRLRMRAGALPSALRLQLARRPEVGSLRPEQLPITLDADTGRFVADGLMPDDYALYASLSEPHQLLATRVLTLRDPQVDLGDIVLGVGDIHVEVRLGADAVDDALIAFSLSLAEAAFGPPARDGGAVLRGLAAGSYRVLVWGESILPRVVDAAVAIDAVTRVEAACVRGVRTEIALPDSIGTLTVRLPDGTSLRQVVLELRTFVRGLPPGEHHVEYETFAGERHAATFRVGSEPGGRVELLPVR